MKANLLKNKEQMKSFNKKILSNIKKVKLLISDVDGVLTDGGMYYSVRGEELKKFNTRDWMGVELLSNKNIPTVILTKEESKIIISRAKKTKIAKICLGVKEKEKELLKICHEFKVKPIDIAYVGDDVNDINIMKKVGFSAVPRDGVEQIKKISNYISAKKGGEGALRDIIDTILAVKFKKATLKPK